jgi:hypothetical protein
MAVSLWFFKFSPDVVMLLSGALWPRGQCARRAIAEAKQRSQWLVIGWMTKIYYLELLRATEGTLSCWSRFNSQPLAPSFKEGRRLVVKIIAESL